MAPVTERAEITRDAVAHLLHALFIGAHDEGERPRALRVEDEKKVDELTAFLAEIARAVPTRRAPARPFTLVDAACGKSALGLLAAALVLSPRGQRARVVVFDREARFIARAATAAEKLRARGLLAEEVEIVCAVHEASDVARWPAAPDLVVALHACGRASDDVIDGTVACDARALLLVPCCYGAQPQPRDESAAIGVAPPGQRAASRHREALGLSRHGLVGRRVAAALIDQERALRLELHGYETVASELFSSTVSPHNLLFRARRVAEPRRMEAHRALHARLMGET